MKTAPLGKGGPDLPRMGYGAMVLESVYGASDDARGLKVLARALEEGMMIDTADFYGRGRNEELIARAVRESGHKPFIATKFGIVLDENEAGSEVTTGWGHTMLVNGTPEYAHRALENSLRRLGMEAIDLWYVHFSDPGTPIEEVVGGMAEAVRSGKVRHLGLSNVTADEVRRAHAVHPIAALQYEYSLWRRELEAEILPVLKELGIALVPWSPVGAGFFAGLPGDFDKQDWRQMHPRFSKDNLRFNVDRFKPLEDIAREKGITPAQLALAWLLHQGDDVFPIPGTRSVEHLEENIAAVDVELDGETLKRIEEVAAPGAARGNSLVV